MERSTIKGTPLYSWKDNVTTLIVGSAFIALLVIGGHHAGVSGPNAMDVLLN